MQAKQKAQGCRDLRAGSAPFLFSEDIALNGKSKRLVSMMLQAFYFCNKATTIISIQHRRP
nr:MAG TPA: hypothetical protein [Caudoviricetes sp.]